jgi:hypothetical protein
MLISNDNESLGYNKMCYKKLLIPQRNLLPCLLKTEKL